MIREKLHEDLVSFELKLRESFDAYEASGFEGHLDCLRVRMALDGDPSFTTYCASMLMTSMMDAKQRSPAHDLFAFHMFLRIWRDDRTARELSGASRKRGAGKKGVHSFDIAMEVFGLLPKTESLEEAWALVAEKRHISESSVKKHWMAWRDQVTALLTADFDEPVDYKTVVASSRFYGRQGK